MTYPRDSLRGHPARGVLGARGGDTWNVIPPEVVIRGATRASKPGVQDLLEQGMRRLSKGIAAAHGCSASIRYERHYPALVNPAAEAGCMLHNPRYDFNDAILTLGASYWSRLVEHCLPEGN